MESYLDNCFILNIRIENQKYSIHFMIYYDHEFAQERISTCPIFVCGINAYGFASYVNPLHIFIHFKFRLPL